MSAREYTTAEAVAMALQHIRICAPDAIVEAALEAINVSLAPVFDMGRSQPTTVPEAAVETFFAEIKRRYPDAYVEPDADTKADVSAGIAEAVNAAQPDMEALRRELDALRDTSEGGG